MTLNFFVPDQIILTESEIHWDDIHGIWSFIF